MEKENVAFYTCLCACGCTQILLYYTNIIQNAFENPFAHPLRPRSLRQLTITIFSSAAAHENAYPTRYHIATLVTHPLANNSLLLYVGTSVFNALVYTQCCNIMMNIIITLCRIFTVYERCNVYYYNVVVSFFIRSDVSVLIAHYVYSYLLINTVIIY
jgi:hypothetical protein